MKQSMQVLTSSKTTEWYTPKSVVDMVRGVMGSIDLDPASHPTPQLWICADRYFTREDDGLSQSWCGSSTIFLNPPYGRSGGRSNQGIWADKLIREIEASDYTLQAILLTKTVPGYKWWDDLFTWKWKGPVCITTGRLSFVRDDGRTHGKSKAATSFWYFGSNEDEFHVVFSSIGRVILP